MSACVGHETVVECQGDPHFVVVVQGGAYFAEGGQGLLTAGVVEGGLY